LDVSSEQRSTSDLPAVDERLIMPMVAVLSSRGIPISEDECSAILATREPSLLDAMLRDVSRCETARDLLAPADRG
jgi:hypothetical protein